MNPSSITITGYRHGKSYGLFDILGCTLVNRLKLETTPAGPLVLFIVNTDDWLSKPFEEISEQAEEVRDLAVELLKDLEIQILDRHFGNLYFRPQNPDDIRRIMDALSWPEEVQKPIMSAYRAMKKECDYPDVKTGSGTAIPIPTPL